MVTARRDATAAGSVVPTARESMWPYYWYRTAESVVRVLPRRSSYWLADRVADALCLFVHQDPLRDNLRHVLPNADERTLRRTVRRNLRNHIHCWVDVMEMSSRKANLPERIDIETFENFIEARESADGKGVVIASMHYGSWEVGLAGWNAMGNSMALLAEVLRPPQLFERVIGARRHQGVRVIPIDTAAMREGDSETARRVGAAAMREVFRCLKSGVDVAMAADRDLIGNGEPMTFFGAQARIPIGVVDVAVRVGAPLMPVILYRNDHRVRAVVYPQIRYDRGQPRDQEVRRVTGELLALFERAIREHPDQWHVLFDRVWPE